jgi:hypothetical protein
MRYLPGKETVTARLIRLFSPGVMAALAAILCVSFGAGGQSNWHVFTSKAGGFSILMPGNPNERVRPTHDASNRLVSTHTFGVETRVAGYFVDYTDQFEEERDPAEALEEAGNAGVEFVHGKLLSKRTLQLDGCPGLEYRVESEFQGSTYVWRGYLRKRRLYQVSVFKSKGDAFTAADERFLSSFKLIEPDHKGR